jgi:magnesium chelatase subunit D
LRAAAKKVGAGCQVPGASSMRLLPTPDTHHPTPITADDLRFKRFKRKTGTLFIFAVDASGSMALNRINQAKGALAHLLERSYVRRDSVAIVSFRAESAEVLLRPCQSMTRAKRILDELCVGGATPLAAGLFSSLEIARRAARRGVRQIVLLLFTDGRANVSLRAGRVRDAAARAQLIEQEIERLGAALRGARVASVVVDTQNRFTSRGEGQMLACKLGGRYIYFGSAAGSEQLSALGLVAEGQR